MVEKGLECCGGERVTGLGQESGGAVMGQKSQGQGKMVRVGTRGVLVA